MVPRGCRSYRNPGRPITPADAKALILAPTLTSEEDPLARRLSRGMADRRYPAAMSRTSPNGRERVGGTPVLVPGIQVGPTPGFENI